MSNLEAMELNDEIRQYFLGRNKGSLDYSTLFYYDNGRIVQPLIFNRNFLCYKSSDKKNAVFKKWGKDIQTYDRYVIEHIKPILKKYKVEHITFVFSLKTTHDTFKFTNDSKELTYNVSV